MFAEFNLVFFLLLQPTDLAFSLTQILNSAEPMKHWKLKLASHQDWNKKQEAWFRKLPIFLVIKKIKTK